MGRRNPEHDREYQRKWRAANKNKMRQYTANQKRKGTHRGTWHKRKATETGLEYLRRVWKTRLASKKKRGVECTVAFTDIEWVTVCPILGVEIDYEGADHFGDNAYSLDRLDPKKGYVKGNVFVMSRRANRLKDDATAADHRRIADWMDKQSGMA